MTYDFDTLYEEVQSRLLRLADDLNGGQFKHVITHAVMPVVLGALANRGREGQGGAVPDPLAVSQRERTAFEIWWGYSYPLSKGAEIAPKELARKAYEAGFVNGEKCGQAQQATGGGTK